MFTHCARRRGEPRGTASIFIDPSSAIPHGASGGFDSVATRPELMGVTMRTWEDRTTSAEGALRLAARGESRAFARRRVLGSRRTRTALNRLKVSTEYSVGSSRGLR
jgi:hypothetical protein